MKFASLAPFVGLLAVVMVPAGCHTHRRHAPPPSPLPSWISTPKLRDSVYLYVIGVSADNPSAATAQDAAYADALAQIRRSIVSELRDPAAETDVRIPMPSAEVVPGCTHTEKTLRGYRAWVQVSFPLLERRKVVDELNKK